MSHAHIFGLFKIVAPRRVDDRLQKVVAAALFRIFEVQHVYAVAEFLQNFARVTVKLGLREDHPGFG
jgi:hypothetical protein